jgi:hypothetical protein
MNLNAVEKVARAVLYEGYMLYPYTASSVKNQQRWNFGVLYPPGYDTSEMQAEFLVLGEGEIDVRVRFLWREEEQQIELCRLPVPGAHIEHRPSTDVSVVSSLLPGHPNLFRVTLLIRNVATVSPASRDQALEHSMLSTHAILTVRRADFISLLDPPAEYSEAALGCQNRGLFPVMAGNDGERDTMLASPIILYDYPQVAPESPGDLFDSTEIDEILTLRILTLSDGEKAEIRSGDARAREILERAESLPPEHLQKLHGALRGLPRPVSGELQVGDKVRLRPRRGADILDIALQGKLATVEAVEQDFDGCTHLAVVLDDDPGRDLGMMRQPGHRFFFKLEEVERIP